MSFRKRIIESRKKLGLNRSDLANMLNVGRSTVHDWEKKRFPEKFPTVKNMERLAEALKVDSIWLRTGIDVKSNDKPLDDILIKKEEYNVRAVEVISMSDLKKFIKSKNHLIRKGVSNMSAAEKFECIRCYIMPDDSMTSYNDVARSIIKGEKLFLDPCFDGGINDGDVLVVDVGGDNNIKVRMYSRDGTDEFLSAVNKDFPAIKIDDNVKIIAKVFKTERKK